MEYQKWLKVDTITLSHTKTRRLYVYVQCRCHIKKSPPWEILRGEKNNAMKKSLPSLNIRPGH